MLISEICPGVVETVGRGSKWAFLEASRKELEKAGYGEPVLVRVALARRWGLWRAWWAVGVSSPGVLAEHPELVGPDDRLEHKNGILIIITEEPGRWIGRDGCRVRALANRWQVRILVTTPQKGSAKVTEPRGYCASLGSSAPHGALQPDLTKTRG